jgi:hypothetical protein
MCYNVTLRRRHVIIIAVDKQTVLNVVSYVCSLRFPARRARGSCFIAICSLFVVPYFSTLCHKRQDIRKIKRYPTYNVCFYFLYNSIRKISHSKKYGSPCQVPIVIVRLKKLEFSQQIFEKYSNIRFHWNPSIRSWIFSCGREMIDMTKLTVAFCNFANAPNVILWVLFRPPICILITP